MKHFLHWFSWAICVAVAYAIQLAYGPIGYFVALVALGAVMIMQWVEGRISVEKNWRYDFWRKQ